MKKTGLTCSINLNDGELATAISSASVIGIISFLHGCIAHNELYNSMASRVIYMWFVWCLADIILEQVSVTKKVSVFAGIVSGSTGYLQEC